MEIAIDCFLLSYPSNLREEALDAKLPKYPMPVALIGRLAIDLRARGRRLGETLLLDALCRVVDAAAIVGCIGISVDARTKAPSGSTPSTTSSP